MDILLKINFFFTFNKPKRQVSHFPRSNLEKEFLRVPLQEDRFISLFNKNIIFLSKDN